MKVSVENMPQSSTFFNIDLLAALSSQVELTPGVEIVTQAREIVGESEQLRRFFATPRRDLQ